MDVWGVEATWAERHANSIQISIMPQMPIRDRYERAISRHVTRKAILRYAGTV